MSLEQSPAKQSRFFSTRGASAFLKENYGIRAEPQTLNRMAHDGEGPDFFKDGRFRLYTLEKLEAWAKVRLGEAAPSAAAHFVRHVAKVVPS